MAVNHSLGALFDYQKHLLEAVSKFADYTVIVNSTAENAGEFRTEVEGKCDLVMIREDVGRDFASWAFAVDLLSDFLIDSQRLILFNDSIFGPLYDLSPVFSEMESRRLDMWGLTDSWVHKYHIQSYFLVFERGALQSRIMRQFFRDYAYPTDRDEIIRDAELSITRLFLEEGLNVGVFCPFDRSASAWLEEYSPKIIELSKEIIRVNTWLDSIMASNQSSDDAKKDNKLAKALSNEINYSRIDEITRYINTMSWIYEQRPFNQLTECWDTLILRFRFPFLKRELVWRNPDGYPNVYTVRSVISERTEYDYKMIEEALKYFPNGIAVGPIIYDDAGRRWS